MPAVVHMTRSLKFVCQSAGVLAERNCSAAFGSLQVRPSSWHPVPCRAWLALIIFISGVSCTVSNTSWMRAEL